VGVAHADNLQASLVVDPVNPTVEVGEVASASYQLTATNDQSGPPQPNNCNASDGTPANVSINVPAHVTASPSSLLFDTCQQADPNNAQTVEFTADAPGDYLITASVSDNGTGTYNTSPAAFTLHVGAPIVVQPPADTTPPVLPDLPNITKEATGPSGASVSYGPASAFDAGDNANVPVVFTPPSPITVPVDGVQTVSYTATDSHNNTATAKSFTVSVVDTTPPVITTPSSVSAYGWNGFFQPIDNGGVVNKAKAGQSIPVKFNLDGPANVNYTATAFDLVDGSVTPVCSPPSGSSFPQGVTTVTCDAVDHRGNDSDSVSFDVTVLGGDLGNNLMYPGYPNFAIGNVPPANVVDGLEEYAASTPGLHYDPVAKQYVYVWATSKDWAGKSGTLRVKLADSGVHTALFNFQK
jgi:hypothetical protein